MTAGGRSEAGRAPVAARRRLRPSTLSVAALVALLAALPSGAHADGAPADERPLALLITVEGAIGPGVSGYVHDGLARAAGRNAALVVIRLDTPGGLDASMRAVVQEMLASPVPVAVWVAPRGARAASAGAFILSAAQVAAMAPGTATGAATPVQLGGGGAEDAAAAKAVNDAVAYARGLADYHGRNPDWAERAVREAASVPATEALELGVIDLVAADLQALLAQVDGRTVRLPTGRVALDTDGLAIEAFDPDWRHRLLALISNPNVAFLLLLIGVYGLIFEFAAPGIGVGGVVGGISLLLGLYALNMLPINVAGLGLMAFGAALLAAEAFVPSFGVLGIGGIVAFVLGAAVTFDLGAPGFRLSPAVVVVSAGLGGSLLLAAVVSVWRSRRRPVAGGGDAMVGARGSVLAWTGGEGVVLVHGERWAATAPAPLRPGQAVRVRARRGLRLEVAPEGAAEEGKTP
jgi:membrane-bound serine protease (ClpP class)